MAEMAAALPPVRRLSGALYGVFVLIGIATSTWVTRTPALRDALGASTEQMGLVLFGFSVGSMLGILSANAVTARLQARRAILAGTCLVLGGLALMAAGAALASLWCAFAGFLCFGLGIGWSDIAMNVECAALERLYQRTLMTTLHGCFSLGTLLGAALGMLMAYLQAPLLLHWLGMAALALAGVWPLVRHIHNHSAVHNNIVTTEVTPASQGNVLGALRDRRVLLIGLFILGMALAEGAANDWLPLLMVDGHGFAEAQGTVIYLLFTLGMVVGRFSGHRLLQRFARVRLMQASALAAALGVALAIFAPVPWLGAASVLFWGLGAALGFPLALSAAGEGDAADSARRVGAVASLGYVAFLVGPPMLGFLGEHWGLRLGMLPVLAMALVAAVLAMVLQVWARRRTAVDGAGGAAGTSEAAQPVA
ncbi:MAG: MFS transporter [Comamonas sp.]